jgi:hypothetical protein
MPYLFTAHGTRVEGTILPAQETKLRNASPQPRRPTRRAGIPRGPLAGVLLAVTLCAAHVPEAVAQPPDRPRPQELWRQFPLDSEPSKAGLETPSTSRNRAEEGGDGSLPTVQIAAIVLAMGLLLMITTGVLAYATRGELQIGMRSIRRMRTRSWRYSVAADAPAARGRRERLGSLASNLRDRAVRAGKESGANALSAVQEALDAYLASRAKARESTPVEELERLKVKLDVHAASASGPAAQELEILKVKLGKTGVAGERPGEVETLKAKLAGKRVAKAGETTTRNAPEAKSVERGAPPKNRSRQAAGVASKQQRKQAARRSRRRKGWQ